MNESRVAKMTKNVKYSLILQVLSYVITFAGRSVFIRCLDKAYLGVGGLFSNILSLLALAELGIGVAMNFFLYKPLANKEEKTVSAYMNFYATAYRVIGCSVIAIGALLTPALPYIIKDPAGVENITLIYLLYVLSSGVSYFFSYKRSIIIADQNGYIDSLNQVYTSLVKTVLQCIVLVLTRNFILYLIVQIAVVLLFNIVISVQADRRYPFLKQYKNERLSKDKKKELFRYIGAMMSDKVGAVVVTGTDNILITMLDSLISTGLYSNYSLIVTSLDKVITPVYSSLSASVGNLNALSETEHKRTVFARCVFLNSWITCFCCVCLWSLFQPFVTLWAGDGYLLDWSIVFVIVLNFYLRTMNRPAHTFKMAGGFFWNDRFRPIIEAAINLIASLILGQRMGFVGVLWGTAISFVAMRFWVEPYVLFKHSFQQSTGRYFVEYGKFTVLTVVLSYVTNWLVCLIPYGSVFGFLGQCMICLIVPNTVMLLLFRKKSEFVYAKDLLMKKLLRRGRSHEA